MRRGIGKMEYNDGDVYSGEFKENSSNGNEICKSIYTKKTTDRIIRSVVFFAFYASIVLIIQESQQMFYKHIL